jgi:hypothetical protein
MCGLFLFPLSPKRRLRPVPVAPLHGALEHWRQEWVIAELGDYIRRMAPGPEAMDLLRRAKQVVGVTKR